MLYQDLKLEVIEHETFDCHFCSPNTHRRTSVTPIYLLHIVFVTLLSTATCNFLLFEQKVFRTFGGVLQYSTYTCTTAK